MLGYTVLPMTHIQSLKILIEKQVFKNNNFPLQVDLKLINNFVLFEDRVPLRTPGAQNILHTYAQVDTLHMPKFLA
jgi:hypothetical protein